MFPDIAAQQDGKIGPNTWGALLRHQAGAGAPASIRYLTFEGGGGKGFAFAGALMALEESGILRQGPRGGLLPPSEGGAVHGVAGASAGAITALMVSLGYTGTQSLEHKRVFPSFMDAPLPGAWVRVRRPPSAAAAARDWTGDIVAGIAPFLPGAAATAAAVCLGPALPFFALRLALKILGVDLDRPPLDRIANQQGVYARTFASDYGLFPGWTARTFFAELLQTKLGQLSGNPQKNHRDATFSEHLKITGIRLAVVGSNLSTKRSEVFSAETTPRFPVADAVRISMGFPLAFKPVVIDDPASEGLLPDSREGTLGHEDLRGFWVDGGLFNNIPTRVFEPTPTHTLGLRLDVTEPAFRIESLPVFLKAVFEGALGISESAISRSWSTHDSTIELNTTGLKTLDFSPNAGVLHERIEGARNKVLNYLRTHGLSRR